MVNWSTPDFTNDSMKWLEKADYRYVSPMGNAVNELREEKDYSRLGEIARKWDVDLLELLITERRV